MMVYTNIHNSVVRDTPYLQTQKIHIYYVSARYKRIESAIIGNLSYFQAVNGGYETLSVKRKGEVGGLRHIEPSVRRLPVMTASARGSLMSGDL